MKISYVPINSQPIKTQRMEQQGSNTRTRSLAAGPTVYLLMAISGLSFCFFLGFPFDNHNESYVWIVALHKASFWQALTQPIIKMESFRPLGMANAWLTYRLSGNIYLQQFCNWFFAASSFLVLFVATKNKISFSFLSGVTTACFFAGYVYLFHLHGVFYGPFQLYTAVLTSIACRSPRFSTRMLVLTAAFTFLVAMYHTFALLLYCAFLTGYAIQMYKNRQKKDYVQLVIAVVATLALAKIILEHKQMLSFHAMADGLVMSYALTEAFGIVTAVAVIMTTLAVLPLMKTTRSKLLASVLTLLLSMLFIYMHRPVLLLWVATCLLKMVIRKNWAMAGLITATSILPIGSGSGSPTYVVFVLMICVYITADDPLFSVQDSPLLKRISGLLLILMSVCFVYIKNGFAVPIVSSMAKPILAEQEKTAQLINIIDWKLKDDGYNSFGLILYDNTLALPVNDKNSIARANRPVTRQTDMDYYIDFVSHSNPNAGKEKKLYVTFGNRVANGKELVYVVKGKWNGEARVYK